MAWSRADTSLVEMSSLEAAVMGATQVAWRVADSPIGAGPNLDSQQHIASSSLGSGGILHCSNSSSCNPRDPTADEIKAGSAKAPTFLMPNPPSLIGRLACAHWVSDKDELVIIVKASL